MTRLYKESRDERFEAYVRKEPAPKGVGGGPCWMWTNSLTDGYGKIQDQGTDRLAHIVSYEHFNGPVPEGLQVSHTCKRRACVNPKHLVLMTHKQVVRRGNAPTAIVHREGICKKGLHKLEGENIIHTSDGFVTCRACRYAAQRAWYERKLARQAGHPIDGRTQR